ncbi:MAG: hemin ABC transporter substrate-binding protein [Xanthobacteraceae bacterium]|nr:hemin ABC transporter substrate-binding protein [Xanthobacteraceae bacterium]
MNGIGAVFRRFIFVVSRFESAPVLAAAAFFVLCCVTQTNAAEADAKRIVSVGGAVTEILYALGLDDRIVGVDSTSLYPPTALKQKSNIGYMRQLSPEGVLGLNPDLVIAIEGSGPPATLSVLREAKVPLVRIPEKFSEDGLTEKIRLIAHVMNVDVRGECLASAVEKDLMAIRELRSHINRKSRIMFVMSLVDGRAMAAGRNTAADEIITLAGGINAVDGYEGYKTIGEEAIVAAKPDVILAMQRGEDSLNADIVFANAAFKLTPASDKKSFIAMDGLYLLGFGPRTAAAAHDLASDLYPSVARETGRWTSRVSAAECRTK